MSKTLTIVGFFEETGNKNEPYRTILSLEVDAPPAIKEGDLITVNTDAGDFMDEPTFIKLIAENTHTHRVQSIRHIFTKASEDFSGYMIAIRLAKAKKRTNEDFEITNT